MGSPSGSGQPIAIVVNGTTADRFDYAIPPRSSQRFSTSGSASNLRAGSIQVTPNIFTQMPSTYAVFSLRMAGTIVSESGLAGALPGASFQTYVESTGDFAHGASSAAETGIAIANPGSTAVALNLEFTILNGVPSTAHSAILIPAGGQFTGFLKQIPGFESLPSSLQGIMRVSLGDAQSVVVAALRGRYNQRGEFLISSVPLLPDSPPPTDAELIVPQIIDGAGYTTSFVFINSATTAANVLLRTDDTSGKPFKLLYK